jgi:Domain of unknown function (DUF222)
VGVSPELEVLRDLAEVSRQIAMLEGRKLVLFARYEELREQDDDHAVRSIPDELAMELHISSRHASAQLALANELPERLPDTFTALQQGRIDVAKARALLEITEPLSLDDARTVEAKVLPTAETRTVAQLRARARYHRDRVDPDAAEARRLYARRERRVYFQTGDGSGALTAVGEGDRLYQAWVVLDVLAHQLRAAGDERDLDALRYDLLLDMILGKFDSRVQVHAYLHVPGTTAAGITEDPGILEGYGPVTAQRCRELIQGSAIWHRVFTDPVTGTVKDVGRRTYRPPGGLAEYVKVRDHTCIAPGCLRPAHACQVDHTVPWAEGGCTCADNLDPLCLRHHRLRHLAGWRITQTEEGTYDWVSPVGQRFTRLPIPILEPVT